MPHPARTSNWFAVPRARRLAASCVAAVALCLAAPAIGDQIVGSGGTMSLSSGKLDLACTDLIVLGTMNVDSAAVVNVRDVIVQPGGILRGGTGSIRFSSNFTVTPGVLFMLERGSVDHDT